MFSSQESFWWWGKSEAALNKEKGHFYGINAILCCCWIICGKEYKYESGRGEKNRANAIFVI